MKRDQLDELFEDLKGKFDLYEPEAGHQKRFAKRLDKRNGAIDRSWSWWKPLSVAASVVLILGLTFGIGSASNGPEGLAAVSPQMAQTQNFFTVTINSEINKLNNYRSPETSVLIDDALQQLERLENEYQKLKKDLVASGNDKRVITAMIQNLQNRIDLLEEVMGMVEEIQKLKIDENEITV